MDITVDIGKSIRDAREVLLSPRKAFKETKKQKGWNPAFSFVLVIAAIGHILAGLYNLFVYPLILPAIVRTFGVPETTFKTEQVLSAIAISYLLTVGMTFVWGGALKIFLNLFRVESSFEESYRVMVYSRVPNYLFSWLPFVNILAALYSFYLMFLALKTETGVENKKAVLIIVSSVVVLFILSVLLVSLVPSV